MKKNSCILALFFNLKKIVIFALVAIISCGGNDIPIEESNINTELTTTTTSQPTTTTLIEEITTYVDFPRRGIIKTSYNKEIPSELVSDHKTSDTRNYENTFYPYESDAATYSINYLKLNENRLSCANVINSEIQNIIQKEIGRWEDSSSYYTKEDAEADGLMYVNYLELSYNLVELGEVFSIIYFWHSYSTGAAHPITHPIAMSYDLKSCEKINVRNIFDTSSEEYLNVLDIEIVKQLCAPLSVEKEACRYVEDYAYYKKFLQDNKDSDIFSSSTTQFAVGQYGLFVQFWEYDFYYASGSELILIPWLVIEDVLDIDGVYTNSFMRAYCVYDTYEFTEYEPMWTWICED